MNRFCILAKLVIGLCLILASPALAQNAAAPAELRVITHQISPFVFKDSDGYKGFSVELWASIAKELDRPFQFVDKKNVTEILLGMQAGEGDVAIAAISFTSEREQKFDFSQPMFESGLQILARSEQSGTASFWQQLWPLLTSNSTLFVFGLLAALIVIPAHIGWLVERNKENHLFPTHYFPGIFHAMYWATGTAADQQPDRSIPAWDGFFQLC